MDQKLIQEDPDSYGSTDNSPPDMATEESPLPFEAVAGNINTIESNCRFLEQASKAFGTTKDNIKLRNNVYVLYKFSVLYF